MRRLLQLVIPCVLLSGCFGPGQGVEVPQDQIYFPVGLALDKDAKHVFVVSSDFDLQYNGGAVQSYDLDKLQKALPSVCNGPEDCGGSPCNNGLCVPREPSSSDPDPSPCPDEKDRADSDRLLFPGRCQPIDPRTIQQDTVKIGAFATDAILRPRDDSDTPEQRLFVPVRGDSTLHWLDVNGEDGTLECGQHGSADKSCNAEHRAGDDPSVTPRGIKLNSEPFALDASEHGETIVVTNQTTGTASLFVNDWNTRPLLKFALASDRIPSRPVGIAAVPQPLAPDEQPNPFTTFLMTFRNSAQVRLLRFAPDGTDDSTNQARPYLVDGSGVAIDANSVGSDSRGIAVDASARKRAKDHCAAGDSVCIDAANLVPLDVYVANRAPSSLLIGRTRPPQEYPYFFQSVALTAGPSRLVVGHVTTASGEDETRVFVACFDSRRVFVYDPQRSRVETEILTGRGPYALVVDPKRQLLYVGHFTDSYVGAYSLDLAHPATYGTMLGTLGTPKSPRASK